MSSIILDPKKEERFKELEHYYNYVIFTKRLRLTQKKLIKPSAVSEIFKAFLEGHGVQDAKEYAKFYNAFIKTEEQRKGGIKNLNIETIAFLLVSGIPKERIFSLFTFRDRQGTWDLMKDLGTRLENGTFNFREASTLMRDQALGIRWLNMLETTNVMLRNLHDKWFLAPKKRIKKKK